MSKKCLALVLVFALALPGLGCVLLGWRFGPVLSMTDTYFFGAPPVVVHRGPDYFLTWDQGRHPFFFRPDYQVKDGRLVFALAGTTSSGNLAGAHREEKIEGADNLRALTEGGAFWWEPEPEPDGRLVPLAIVDASSQAALR